MEPKDKPIEQAFSVAMKRSRLQMPFDDFEERMMMRIQDEMALKHSTSAYKKWAVLFFVTGITIGMFINYFLALPKTLAGIPANDVLLAFRIAFLLLFLKQLDNLLGLFSKSTFQKT